MTINQKTSLVKAINKLPAKQDRPLIIAISGFGGSGKTMLAKWLEEQLEDSAVVCIDSFSNHEWRRSSEWDNFDRKRFEQEVLKPAQTNHFPLVFSHVPWPGHPAENPINISEVKYLIVEGCSVLHPGLLKYYDFKVWINCPLETATERAMWRDRFVHKDEHDHLWQNIWMPNDQDFFDKYQPSLKADFIFNN
ncbi:MAG TPA: hypothetical protein VLG37_00850 [Candidatus Saccharimonadales bacterium]|nr:hypothetical protein [Candidatus Saccharimonadales bacterium]